MKQMEMPTLKMVFATGLAMLIVFVVSAKVRADKPAESPTPIAKEIAVAAFAPTTTTPPTDLEDDKGFWLTIRPTGFETKEMTLDAGDYFVVIQNATGIDHFALRIQREGGDTIEEVRLPRFRKYWKHMVTLTAGRYVVSEIDHPEWNCVVTVN